MKPTNSSTYVQWRVAKETHKPSTLEKQRAGEGAQRDFASRVGGTNESGNGAFYVLLKGGHAIEFKSVTDNDNDKITMRKESRLPKIGAARRNKWVPHTIVEDMRGRRPIYYYRRGVGSFRVRAMERFDSVTELRKRILSK